MTGRDVTVFGLGAVVTASVGGALYMYYRSTRNQPVSDSDETHVKEVIPEEENKRPLNPVPPEVSTGEETLGSIDLASLEVNTGGESQRSIDDLDSNELEEDGGNWDVSYVHPDEPPSYQERPPSYSSRFDEDAEPTDQQSQQQPPSRFELDAVILHASHDEEEAKECQKFLEQHAMIGNVRADVGFIDDLICPGSYTIDGLCGLFLKCRLVLVFHTKNLKKDGLMNYAKYINLNQAVKDPNQNKRIIPLVADEAVLSEELEIFGPVSYHDENFSQKMSKLFTYWRNILP